MLEYIMGLWGVLGVAESGPYGGRYHPVNLEHDVKPQFQTPFMNVTHESVLVNMS